MMTNILKWAGVGAGLLAAAKDLVAVIQSPSQATAAAFSVAALAFVGLVTHAISDASTQGASK